MKGFTIVLPSELLGGKSRNDYVVLFGDKNIIDVFRAINRREALRQRNLPAFAEYKFIIQQGNEFLQIAGGRSMDSGAHFTTPSG